ncbi:MAG: hypothetical protein ACLU84_02710 [Clostridia bacterium]
MKINQRGKREVSKKQMLVVFYIAISAIFALPSVIYLLQNHSVYRFIYMYSYTFTTALTSSEYILNALMFMGIWITLSILYYLLLKYHTAIFKNVKQILLFSSIVGILFVAIIPCTSLDVYSYIANRMGR